MKGAIEVKGLQKSYADKEVLRGIDFTVPEGETFAILGANGAGKTTALECIEGLRKPDSGAVSTHGTVGIQLQSASLPQHIRGSEAISLFSKWNGAVPGKDMLDALGTNEIRGLQYRQMSVGQKRRLHLILALLNDPDIVFLDEPTAGLDVEGRTALHGYIRMLKRRGKTIVLATHDMSEVESLCDRIVILRDGRIAFSGTAAELTQQVGTRYNVRIHTNAGSDEFEVENTGAELIALLEDYERRHIAIQDMRVDRGSLEQHFVRVAGKETAV